MRVFFSLAIDAIVSIRKIGSIGNSNTSNVVLTPASDGLICIWVDKSSVRSKWGGTNCPSSPILSLPINISRKIVPRDTGALQQRPEALVWV
ncbi:unnamed protein product [Vitrella brassicaformis CCMP3155]|uniref:Uncharacterized protein n=1 Tax=Vitrella brassicaformis (strain CCMP3155) TaxID=1169540 RepID=A0A0G4GD30_VITBC|nr:unnamed protein product [Vitrella brassicaformis CCMP3155]|eukprot:CEM26898.1 unnamed protein product [Vitrella brassicaformis CCMP3155]